MIRIDDDQIWSSHVRATSSSNRTASPRHAPPPGDNRPSTPQPLCCRSALRNREPGCAAATVIEGIAHQPGDHDEDVLRLTPQISGVTVRPLAPVVLGRLFGQLIGSCRPERPVDLLMTRWQQRFP
ncbi:hypothetical protein AB0M48_21400 [Lentzea sp. NPDC051208]|uniref:hypothetical protein n=1 Tax=Lentzea sp. NPDC051208 TaxID=3154642 RepID=UPI0034236FA7